ncbi:MAG: DUF695 domain-containing protein [Flavobacterium sp.]|nr:MAG: DUF695 domain-containing protein [Flavobacterium sp.]
MEEFKVIIPEESYQIIEFRQENLPAVAIINVALKDFEPKEVFAWHCSIMINLNDVVLNSMPSEEEVKIVDKFGDFLDEKIKGDPEKPNALFVARITWNSTRELIWRIYDPEIANEFLSKIIESEEYPRNFDYGIDQDAEWKLAEWHLSH